MIDSDLQARFNSIMVKGRKTNTYKFALAKFLLDFTDNFTESQILNMKSHGQFATIDYSDTAMGFLKYYWHQECKYRIRQNSDVNKLPYVVRIIREEFDVNDAKKSFSDLSDKKKEKAAFRIQSRVFGSGQYSNVVPCFQNLPNLGSDDKNVFYNFDSKRIMIRPEVLLFFKINKHCLLKTVVLEWSKFLERRNNMPMLISKIENDIVRRGNLAKYKKMFAYDFYKCFYCECRLYQKSIHVDHFIPWSYIFEDDAWNLVLACNECNCKKSDSLAQKSFLTSLIDRNYEYGSKINGLAKSLQELGTDAKMGKNLTHTWESEMVSRYKNCKNQGFTLVTMP
ncbi:MAG: HNH endonuclease [Cenarchaeum symbiont of Oopsacas minuta]|nr:HNH endonuclease [Cenarchaeum symbiont of Oopsacas minuta]